MSMIFANGVTVFAGEGPFSWDDFASALAAARLGFLDLIAAVGLPSVFRFRLPGKYGRRLANAMGSEMSRWNLG